MFSHKFQINLNYAMPNVKWLSSVMGFTSDATSKYFAGCSEMEGASVWVDCATFA